MAATRPASYSSRHVSISFFSSNGSPIWTEGRLASDAASNAAEARMDAPPMPSLPVDAPSRTATLPGVLAAPCHQLVLLHQTQGHDVDQRVLGVAVGELDLTTKRGHTDGVPVPGDPGHHTVEEIPVVCVVE